MLGTLLRRVTVRTLDAVVDKGRASGHGPVRVAAGAIDRARSMVGLDAQRLVDLPSWATKPVEQPMWDTDRKKLEKWRVDRGIDKPAADAEAKPEPQAPIVIYFKRGCPYTRAALDLLREREYEFEQKDITGDQPTLSWLKTVTKRNTTPQIFLHGEPIGGYEELRALDHSGELAKQLGVEAGETLEAVEPDAPAEIEVEELAARIDDGAPVLLLDVRSPGEVAEGIIEHAVHIPIAELAERAGELDAEGVWIAYCHSGQRSRAAVDVLRKQGVRSVVSLRGGMERWQTLGRDVVSLEQSTPRTKSSARVSLPVVHPEHSPFEGLSDDWMGEAADELEGESLVERVREVLDECRPLVQADGGDIELLDVQGNTVHIQLTGNCVGCPSAQATLKQGIERRLKSRIPQIEGIQAPQLK